MPRLMSVSLTEDAVLTRTKTVTRRLGWTFLNVGDHVTLCRKVMGRRKGEPLVRLCDVEIIDVRREQLREVTDADVLREGFAGWTRREFIAFFRLHMQCDSDTELTRVEWRYLDAV